MSDLANATMLLQIASDPNFTNIIYTYEGSYVSSLLSDVFNLELGNNYYARVKYTVPDIGPSPWSSIINFSISPPTDAIGICMYSTGGNGGVFKHIDLNGNFVTDFNYLTHPIYNGLSQISIDGCVMMEVPTIYVKTALSGPVNSDSYGKKCWWISSIPFPGFKPAGAFKRNNTIKDKIWLGTYLGHTETVRTKTCIGSKYNKTPARNVSKSAFKTYIENRNSGGITGFRLFDIYDLGLVKTLLLIFGGGTNTQTIWGNNTTHTSYPKTGKTNCNALYMCDLWEHYQCHTDLITLLNENIQLTNPFDLSTINTTVSPGGRGWIVDMCSGAFDINGDTHDLMELFIPSTLNSSMSNSTFPDYNVVYTTYDNSWLSGGRWDDWDNAGLFCFDNSYWDPIGYINVGCRIAKS